jgi:hypothetical protein
MEKVTTILNDNIEKQTLKSIDKLVDAFDTTTNDIMEEDNNNNNDELSKVSLPISLKPSINANVGIYAGEGENKVIVSKKSKRKQKHGYRMKAIVTATKSATITKQQKGTSSLSSSTIREYSESQPPLNKRSKARPKFFCSF